MIAALFWDWNGTLLDDRAANLRVLNQLLRERHLSELALDEYRSLFRIPILDFYHALGFTFENESYDDVAREYVALYSAEFDSMTLSQGIEAVLGEARHRGIRQFVVSATNEPDLLVQVRKKGIAGYFEKVVGNDSIHGKSKIQRAVQLLEETGLKGEEVLFVGDTDHDHEVAQAIGARCVLYDGGHQHLATATVEYEVIEDLSEILKFLPSSGK